MRKGGNPGCETEARAGKAQRLHLSGSASLTGHVQPPSSMTSHGRACRPDPSPGTLTHQGSEDPGSWEGRKGASSCSHRSPRV